MAENDAELMNVDFPEGTDPSTLPTSRSLPIGDLVLEIKSFDRVRSNPDNSDVEAVKRAGGKVMIKTLFLVAEPTEYKGSPHTHQFVIGSDEDPNALKGGTWTRNGTQLMGLFKQAKVAIGPGTRLPEAFAAAQGQKVGATSGLGRVNTKRLAPDGKPYAARVEIKSFWEVGKKDPRVIEDQGIELASDVGGPQAPAGHSFTTTD